MGVKISKLCNTGTMDIVHSDPAGGNFIQGGHGGYWEDRQDWRQFFSGFLAHMHL